MFSRHRKLAQKPTCVTICPCPPWQASKTGSIQNVARVVLTVDRTRFITLTAINPMLTTTFIVNHLKNICTCVHYNAKKWIHLVITRLIKCRVNNKYVNNKYFMYLICNYRSMRGKPEANYLPFTYTSHSSI